MDERDNLQACTFEKTILMIFVMLGHSIVFWGKGHWFVSNPVYLCKSFYYAINWIGSFHTFAFVLVSGYIYYALRYEKMKYRNKVTFVVNKLKRLIVPCYFINLVWIIPVACYFFKYDEKTILVKYILGFSPNQAWFLFMLFNVFIIFNFTSSFFADHNFIGAILALGVSYILGNLGGKIIPNYFQVWTSFQYVPFFWIGFKIRQYEPDLFNKISPLMWLLLDIALFLLCQITIPESFAFQIIHFGLSYLLTIVGSLAAFFILRHLSFYLRWERSLLFSTLAHYSMPMYLFHQQIIYFTIYWLNGKVNPYFHAGINFVVALVGSFIISSILMRWKATRFLIGEKV